MVKFRDLPTEIRLMIFKNALGISSDTRYIIMVTDTRHFVPPGSARPPQSMLPLLHVNKQFYEETIDSLFSNASFQIAVNMLSSEKYTENTSRVAINPLSMFTLSGKQRLKKLKIRFINRLSGWEEYKCQKDSTQKLVDDLAAAGTRFTRLEIAMYQVPPRSPLRSLLWTEPLAKLRRTGSINNISVYTEYETTKPDFARKLERYLRGEHSRPLKKLEDAKLDRVTKTKGKTLSEATLKKKFRKKLKSTVWDWSEVDLEGEANDAMAVDGHNA